MFRKAKNIDTAFRQLRQFFLCTTAGLLGFCFYVAYKSYVLAGTSQERIYILAQDKALEAYASERKDNIPVEARDHVKMFHHYFFTLDPDDQMIDRTINKALYLADGTAKWQYDNLKENGYYINLISGNISQAIRADSISVDTKVYPYPFVYTGEQMIIRPTTIITRKLITQGVLRHVARSDHNPHGFLIERWKTIENSDLKIETRE